MTSIFTSNAQNEPVQLFRSHADEIDALMGISRNYTTERQQKIAALILAAVTAAGHLQILSETAAQWVGKNDDRIWEAEQSRAELLKAIEALS